MSFSIFSPLHFVFLATVACVGVSVGIAARRHPGRRAIMIRTMGLLLALLECVWYFYLLRRPFSIWPGVLPLHLCDVVVWLTVVSALFPVQRVRELAYYWGMSGTSLALLMPDVQGLSISYPVVQFFVSHGLVVATLLVLTLSREFRPGQGSLVRGAVALHLFAAFVGGFNAVFGTNYLYLCSRPSGATILDLMGAWPWYLLVADVLGMGIFFLLWLPFRRPERA